LPGLLFNIGQCHKKLGEWNKAAFFYRRYLARVPEGTDVQRLQELIAEMDEKEKEAAAQVPPAAPTPVAVPAVAPALARPMRRARCRWCRCERRWRACRGRLRRC